MLVLVPMGSSEGERSEVEVDPGVRVVTEAGNPKISIDKIAQTRPISAIKRCQAKCLLEKGTLIERGRGQQRESPRKRSRESREGLSLGFCWHGHGHVVKGDASSLSQKIMT